MAYAQKFEDLEVWKKARVLTKSIYKMTKEGEFARDFGLRDQIRRASVSIMSNIAEGFDRGNKGDFLTYFKKQKALVVCWAVFRRKFINSGKLRKIIKIPSNSFTVATVLTVFTVVTLV